MVTVQVILSAVAAGALVAVLAVCLLLVVRRLRAIAEELGRVSYPRPARGDDGAPPDVAQLNYRLERLVDELAEVTDRARAAAGRDA